jgi:hypothetical protein
MRIASAGKSVKNAAFFQAAATIMDLLSSVRPDAALHLVSDVPEEMDRQVTTLFFGLHLEIGIAAKESLERSGLKVKHSRYQP